MTVEKRFKVVQSRRSGGWGILDTVASEFGVDNFAPFGELTNYGGTIPVSVLTDKAAKLNAGTIPRGQFQWESRGMREFQ